MYRVKKKKDGHYYVVKNNRPLIVGLVYLLLFVGLIGFSISMAGCCTIQTGPPNDLTPYNDCMTTQMAYMLIDALPKVLK